MPYIPLPMLSGLPHAATSSAVDIVAVVAFVTLWVQLTKPFLEYRYFRTSSDSPIHDAVIKLYTFVVALVTVTILLVAPPSLNAVFYSVVAVLSAMGLYHQLNGGVAQTPVIDPQVVAQIEAVVASTLRNAGVPTVASGGGSRPSAPRERE